MYDKPGHPPSAVSSAGVTVRLADHSDCRALLRLAELDSKTVPTGSLVVAEVGGETVAAVPVGGGRPIADPFERTASLLEVLELRAAQLRAEAGSEASSLAERVRDAARAAGLAA